MDSIGAEPTCSAHGFAYDEQCDGCAAACAARLRMRGTETTVRVGQVTVIQLAGQIASGLVKTDTSAEHIARRSVEIAKAILAEATK